MRSTEYRSVKFSLSAIAVVIAAATMGSMAHAAAVNQTANDGIGTSSFNAAGTWSNAAAPAAGNTYTNVDGTGLGHLLRTPGSAGNFTFAGDSLTIGSNNATDLNQSLIFKGTGGSVAAPNVITVGNLILSGGYIRQGSGSADFFALAGGLNVTSSSGINIQGPTFITAAISGSGDLHLDTPGNTDAARTLHFDNGANTWTGNLILTAGTPNFSKFELDSTGNLNFLIGANGVNNSVNGAGTAIYDGTFNFNLSGADNTIGDSWIVAAATGGQTYTATFAVNGFTNSGGGIWDQVAHGVDYEFNQATGALSVQAVPEPASLGIAAVGALALMARRRR